MKVWKLVLLTVLMFGASYSHAWLVVDGTNTVDITGSASFIDTYDSSTLNTHVGSVISYISAFDSSTINVNGGDIGWLQLYDDSVANVSSSEDLSWIKMYDNSTANITFVDELSWLLVNGDSTANIYGSNFSYSYGLLSGTWGNGIDFKFWAVEESDLMAGTVGEWLPDNIILHDVTVPEPSTLALLVLGLALAGYRKSRV